MDVIDINGKSQNLIEKNLSNLALHEFKFRGFSQTSAESVIQCVKRKNSYQQAYALTLTGIRAKREGAKIDWRPEQTFYWFGVPMKRESVVYQQFLDELYISLLANKEFKQYLLQSEGCQLVHSVGSKNPINTVLTEFEFCDRLKNIRNYILTNKEYSEQEIREHLSLFHDQYINQYLCYRNHLNI